MKHYEMHQPINIPATEGEKRALAYRVAQMLTAQHNFVVDVTLGLADPDEAEGTAKTAKAIEELINITKRVYPAGPEQLRADIAGLGPLVGAKVLTVAIEKNAQVPVEGASS